jgi:endonuclease YncB( thermonuclease family)
MYRMILVAAVVVTSCSGTTTSSNPEAGATAEPGVTDTPPPGARESVQLRHVFDGDSIEVSLSDGSRAEVRLLGINAPEADECHGDFARQALEGLTADQDLSIVTDEDDTDQFGRLLRYVYAGNRNVNLALVASGDALALQSGHGLEREFVEAGDAAAQSGLGMWSPSACRWDGNTPQVALTDYVFDPPGRDAEGANGEWVELRNEGSTVVEMGGWVLRDESTQHRFIFPEDSRLEPGRSLTVRSGCGTPSNDELFWCATDPVWSNGGDTIILQLPTGTVVVRERFAGDF